MLNPYIGQVAILTNFEMIEIKFNLSIAPKIAVNQIRNPDVGFI
jgi:hypothetical protein